MQELCNAKAKRIAEQVVAHDDDHDKRARLHDARRICRDDSSDDEDDGDDGDEREHLDRLLYRTLKEVIDEKSENDRGDDDLRNGDHHFPGGNVNPLPGEPKCEERCHDRRENRRCHRHGDGECDVSACEICHDVGRGAAGTGADEDHACGELRRQGKSMCEYPRQERHDAELSDSADKHVFWTLQYEPKILETERHAHAEHNNAQENGDIRHRP